MSRNLIIRCTLESVIEVGIAVSLRGVSIACSSNGKPLTTSAEYYSRGQEHPHPFIHILNPAQEVISHRSFISAPQPSDPSQPLLVPLNPKSPRSELVRLPIDVMLIETIVAKHTKRFGLALVAKLQTLCEVLARCLCCALAEALQGKCTSARGERLRCDEGELGWGSAGGAVLVLGLIVLSTPLLEARWTEDVVAVGMLGVDCGYFHADVARFDVWADAGGDAFHGLF